MICCPNHVTFINEGVYKDGRIILQLMSNIQRKPVKCVLCSTGQGTSVGSCQRWKVTFVSTWGGLLDNQLLRHCTSHSALSAVQWIGFGRLSVCCFEVQFSLQLQELVRITKYRVKHKSVNTRVRHKSVNTPLSHERLVVRTWLAVYSGWG